MMVIHCSDIHCVDDEYIDLWDCFGDKYADVFIV